MTSHRPPIGGDNEIDFEIRRNDYSLSNEQVELRELFRHFFQNEVSSTRVREAEPLSFDQKLWRQLADLGLVAMSLPENQGGIGSTLIDLALVSEQFGQVLAPVSLVEAVTAVRLLSRLESAATTAWIAEAAAGRKILTVALNRVPPGRKQLIPAGAIAEGVIGLDGDDLVIVTKDERPPHAPNLGATPLAWWELSGAGGSRTVLASGKKAWELYEGACNEWRLLTAAALVGLGDAALKMGIEYSKVRNAFGMPIGAFQAVAHSLVDGFIAVEGARHLTWKAAWYLEHEPWAEPAIVPMAFLNASTAANKAVEISVHVHGGSGFMQESDVTLYFVRAKAWGIVVGDRNNELSAIADLRFPPRRPTSSVIQPLLTSDRRQASKSHQAKVHDAVRNQRPGQQ